MCEVHATSRINLHIRVSAAQYVLCDQIQIGLPNWRTNRDSLDRPLNYDRGDRPGWLGMVGMVGSAAQIYGLLSVMDQREKRARHGDRS